MGHLSRERYHWPITIIKIVRTKGKAGYRVWKLAGGQGDHEINLPVGSLEWVNFFFFEEADDVVANPLLIWFNQKFMITRTKLKSVFLELRKDSSK